MVVRGAGRERASGGGSGGELKDSGCSVSPG